MRGVRKDMQINHVSQATAMRKAVFAACREVEIRKIEVDMGKRNAAIPAA